MRWKGWIDLIKESVYGWTGGQTFQLGAAPALAFYAAFALAPMLVIAIAVAGLFFGKEAAQGQLTVSLKKNLDPAVANAFEVTLKNVYVTRSGWSATLVGLGVVLFAATGLFVQLQAALNCIWGVQAKPGRGLWSTIRGRLVAFIMVLIVGALLLLSLIANSVMSALYAFLPDLDWPGDTYLWVGVNWLLLIGLLTLLFSMIYKLLPDAVIGWRDVWVGAFITAIMCAFGNFLIGTYLGRIAPVYAYGAAGAPLMVMFWIYYSFHVLLFGAEFTKNFTRRYGKPVRPADYAMFAPWQTQTGPQNAANEVRPGQSSPQ
jgi:membrane protein